jgi:hypothetical protein
MMSSVHTKLIRSLTIAYWPAIVLHQEKRPHDERRGGGGHIEPFEQQ